MGTPNTADTVEIVDSGLISTQELAMLDGVGGKDGVHPSRLFGPDWEKRDAPPHVKSYSVVGDALHGQPIDSWVRHGVYGERQRRPEYKDFSAITQGLSLDERVRFTIILIQYLKDINKVYRVKDDMLELETLHHTRKWVDMLICTVDPEARSQLSKIDNPDVQRYFRAPAAEQAATAEVISASAPEVVAPVQTGMRQKFQRLLEGTILGRLFS